MYISTLPAGMHTTCAPDVVEAIERNELLTLKSQQLGTD